MSVQSSPKSTKFSLVLTLPVLAVLSLLLSSCIPGLGFGSAEYKEKPRPDSSSISAELKSFYEQEVDWQPCELNQSVFCATVSAPLDWENPTLDSIELAIAVRPGGSKAESSLLVNPGGPGASGISLARDYAEQIFSQDLLSSYNLVGFDPRGVGESTPVKCFENDQEKDEFLFSGEESDVEIGSEAYFIEVKEQLKPLFDGCEKYSGRILSYIDSYSVAKDMDLIRFLMGDEKLNYLGFSYGSYLGTLYANLFPSQVGRVVLDGAMDPSVGIVEVVSQQTQGFETGYNEFLAYCLQLPSCSFSGDLAQAQQQTIELLESLDESVLNNVDGRKLDGSSLELAISAALYNQDYWPVLIQMLQGVYQGNPELAFTFIDLYLSRDNGQYEDNSYEAGFAINCLDYPVKHTVAEWHDQYKQLQKEAPLFGKYNGYSEFACDSWPVKARYDRPELKASELSALTPIVIVGTIYDTATPYGWAKNLNAQLPNSVLLSFDGQGHTAYGVGNTCIVSEVDAFLIDGVLPEAGKVCE